MEINRQIFGLIKLGGWCCVLLMGMMELGTFGGKNHNFGSSKVRRLLDAHCTSRY